MTLKPKNKKRDFADFLHGEANTMAFNEFGYKGYSVWNVNDDTLIYQSGLGPAVSVLGDRFGYKEYYSLNRGWLFEKHDMEFFEKISPENIIDNGLPDTVEHIFTFSSNYVR